MNEPARPIDALQTSSLAGQSGAEVLDTEPNEHDAERLAHVDTLGAADALPDVSLDDRLLHRDLKARIFGADGRVTIGRYEVLRRIGRGGMGTVYVAHDPELDRKVALKVLRADRKRGQERMMQEARALAKLAHPHVVTVHEVGLHDDRVFVAMELVEGTTLREWLEARPSRTELYDVFGQAARGLQAAHRAGLVHRDFKPENVLIGDDGRVRVVDFGVAKASDSLDPEVRPVLAGACGDDGPPQLTHTGQLLGTPAYMAPEQFLGASVDARTDVFAFCVALYEALAGRRPFDGDDTAAVSCAVLQGRARPLPVADVPSALAALVQQGLSREPDDRPDSLDDLVTALEAGRAPALVPVSVQVPVPAWSPRRRKIRLAAAVISATGLGAGLVMMRAGTSAPAPAEPVAAAPMAWGAADGQEDPAEAIAFAAIASAPDDDARLAAAEAFLERFGERASEVRRAIAHSTAGDVQWRRSCPSTPFMVQGLCVEEQPIDRAAARCTTPRRGPIVQHQRTAVHSEPAQEHLRAAVALAGVSLASDDPLRPAFAEAIARARVQLADAELEDYLTLELPPELDFESAAVLSEATFVLFHEELVGNGDRLLKAYAHVKPAGDPRWTLVAAARSGMVSETGAASMARTLVPAGLAAGERETYCEALEPYVVEPGKVARRMYAYCVEKARQHGLSDEPIVAYCRHRLERQPPP